jgi:hypothetical protein
MTEIIISFAGGYMRAAKLPESHNCYLYERDNLFS